MRPRLIGKHPEEETYIISMDGTTNPHSSCKVARSNPKGLYGPVLLGSILSRMQCKRIMNNKVLLNKLLNYPDHTNRKQFHYFLISFAEKYHFCLYSHISLIIDNMDICPNENPLLLSDGLTKQHITVVFDEAIEPPSNMTFPAKFNQLDQQLWLKISCTENGYRFLFYRTTKCTLKKER